MRISDWSSDVCSSDLEALKEREVLWGIAPHIIHPLRFVLPYRDGLRPRWLLRLGLFLYDHIGGRRKLPETRSVDLRRHVAGAPTQRVYVQGFDYSDARTEKRRVGKEWVSTCRSRWCPDQ